MNEFEKTIKTYLDSRAKEDEQFAGKYAEGQKLKKTIETCCKYIINEVRKTGRQGFADDEIYGMAVHYYDESSIEPVTKGGNATVVVNHDVKLTPEEEKKIREEARRETIAAIKKDEIAKVRKEAKEQMEIAAKRKEVAEKRPKISKKPVEQTLSLFDF